MADDGGYGTMTLPDSWSDWDVVRELGRGSFSVVFEAERKDNPAVRCAIKRMTVPRDESEYDGLFEEGSGEEHSGNFYAEIVDDYIREIRVMEQLKGVPCIVGIEDYQVVPKEDGVGSHIFIRMELLTPLDKYISDKELSEAEIIRIGTEICTALAYCHEKGIIHRDIKPANLFVNDRLGTHVFYKLGDFGIARGPEEKTGDPGFKGTPNYMAPEIASGAAYGAEADLYSLGLTLYWLANNRRLPFFPLTQLYSPAARREALARRLSGEPFQPPAGASEALSAVILKACSFKPEERFHTAREMKAALEALLQNDMPGPASGPASGKAADSGTAKRPTKPGKILMWSLLLLICVVGLCVFLFTRQDWEIPAVSPTETAQDLPTLIRNAVSDKYSVLVDHLAPVGAVRESADVRFEIISAAMSETQALIVYSVQDLEGERFNEETWVLVRAEIGKTNGYSMPLISFIKEENKVIFVEAYDFNNKVNFTDRDITFRLGSLYDTTLTKFDMMPYIRQYAKKTEGTDPPERIGGEPKKILDPSQSLNIRLHRNVTLTGIGWIDGQLHLQFHFPGQESVYLGHGVYSFPVDLKMFDYSDDDLKRRYTHDRLILSWGDENEDDNLEWMEFIYDFDRNPFDQFRLEARIQETNALIDGNWIVKVPLSRIWVAGRD